MLEVILLVVLPELWRNGIALCHYALGTELLANGRAREHVSKGVHGYRWVVFRALFLSFFLEMMRPTKMMKEGAKGLLDCGTHPREALPAGFGFCSCSFFIRLSYDIIHRNIFPIYRVC
jgi:hypothetical protein